MWDAAEYLKFSDERARPFVDLLTQVRHDGPKKIVDLGCGTGHLTQLLSQRWPEAHVQGIDNSPEMLEQARPQTIPGRLEFVEGCIEDWHPAIPLDLVVSNASLHWIDDHAKLLEGLVRAVAPGGGLAIQMPRRFETPSQFAIDQTSADPRWVKSLEGAGPRRSSVLPIAWYVHKLHDMGFVVNAWETTYYHLLTGEDPVLRWYKGAGLRPILSRLAPEHVEPFLTELGRRFRAAFPMRNGVTLFPFPRLFIVATRRAA